MWELNRRPRQAGFGLVIHRRHILLVQLQRWMRKANQWTFPGGLLEPGESFEQGAIREVMEETGVAFKPERLFWSGREGETEVHMFLGTGKGELRPQFSEIAHVKWFTLTEAMSLDLAYKCADRILEAAEQKLL